MGTRNLTCAVIDGEYKIAQYGQWDGHPDGQGKTALQFLREKMKRKVFEEKLRAVEEITDDEYGECWTDCGADPKSDFVTMDVSKRFSEKYPYLHRDCGAEILAIVQDSPKGIKLRHEVGFARESLFCEWCYVADFDRDTFEVYSGFNTTSPLPKSARFYYPGQEATKPSADGTKYYPVRLLRKYNLRKLPTVKKFLADMKKIEDRREEQYRIETNKKEVEERLED